MHLLTALLALLYFLSMGVSPHVLDLLALIGGLAILGGLLAGVLLLTEALKRAVLRLCEARSGARRVNRELFLLEEGTCDGRPPEELEILAEEAAMKYRRRMRGG